MAGLSAQGHALRPWRRQYFLPDFIFGDHSLALALPQIEGKEKAS
jgi:hypothetical protein